jgi:hypothetical protein
MKKIATMTLLLAAATSAGMAAEAPANLEPSDEVRVGLGVACDTEGQIERYASLIGANDSAQAVQIVNDEAQNPRACGAVAIAYKISKQTVASVRNAKGSFRIVEIVVIAASADGSRWQAVDPHPTQYIAVKEIEA